MGNTLVDNCCGHVLINTELHPLAEKYRDARLRAFGEYMPTSVQQALNNIVLASIVVPFPAFMTDSSGVFQSDGLKGKRLVTVLGGNVAMDLEGGYISITPEITLDPETGIITSVYADQTHVATIGYYIATLPDLMP